jgi:hypothetical protein
LAIDGVAKNFLPFLLKEFEDGVKATLEELIIGVSKRSVKGVK